MSSKFAAFEIDILAEAGMNPAFRRRLSRMMRSAEIPPPFDTKAHRDVWSLIASLGTRDVLTGAVLKMAGEVLREDDREEFLRAGKRILKHEPEAAEFGLEQLETWIRRTGVTGQLSLAADALVSEDDDRLAETIRKAYRLASLRGDTFDETKGGNWFEDWEERQALRRAERDEPESRLVIPTRIPTLDDAFNGGLRPEELFLILAHTNVGKSFFAQHLSFVSAMLGYLTVYVSTEMSKMEVDTRFDARLLAVPSTDFYKFDFTDDDLEEFEAIRESCSKKLKENLFTYSVGVDTLNRYAVEELLQEVQDKAGRKIQYLVNDTADQYLPSRRVENERLRHKTVYQDQKYIAGEWGIPVASTCHVPGDVDKKYITEFDTAESKDKGKLAHKIVSLNQTPAEYRHGVLRGYLSKNRGGIKYQIFYLKTDFPISQIEEIPKPKEVEDDDSAK